MTDRELLEKAAKAAGLDLFVWGTKGAEKFCIKLEDRSPGNLWNPLTDDGDALRLAVKLRIEIMWPRPGDHVCAGNVRKVGAGSCEDDLSDPYAATRRAIVRAAAAIGDRA